MFKCVLHDSNSEQCKATRLNCFTPNPNEHVQCLALNNAYHIGTKDGIERCTKRVRELNKRNEE